MLKQKVIAIISEKIKTDSFTILTPKDPQFGDYAIHIASFQPPGLRRSEATGKPPGLIIKQLATNNLFSKVEQKGDFINFYINPIALLDEANKIVEQKEKYGHITVEKPKRINLEYGDPNTHKLPHIGHLFSYIVGEAWTRILEASGNTIYRCCYQGDVGLHVAKCLYKLKNWFDDVSNKTLEEKATLMQKAYQEGSRAYEKDETAKNDIDVLNKKIYQNDAGISEIWQKSRRWSLDYYAQFEKRLGIIYDKHYFESMVAEAGKKIVYDNVGEIFEQSDDAIVFRGEKHGLHTRVFITKLGNPTYEAKDLGLASLKMKDWPFDKAIITTASEQNAYFKVVIKAIEETIPELKGKVNHIGFGMVDLKQGKMSSRSGNIISAVELVDIVKQKVIEIVKQSDSIESVNEVGHIAEIVAIGAIKYSFLKSEAKKNTTFDIEESISIHGNSGPYLQYTYARCMSVLNKALPVISSVSEKSHDAKSEISRHFVSRDGMVGVEELTLLRSFPRFPEVVEDAAKNYAPHLICTYLYDLAQKFNLFYDKCPILKADEEQRQLRLLLTASTAQLIKNGLYLLGIEVLDHI